MGKATVCCSYVTTDAFPGGLYQVLRPAFDIVFLTGICDKQAFSKPKSPMSADYNVILDSENPNNLVWSEGTDNIPAQLIA